MVDIVDRMGTINASLGAVVRAAIRDAELNQRAISSLTGIPYTTLRRKLDGLSSFTVDELMLIGSPLNVLPSELIGAAERKAKEFAA